MIHVIESRNGRSEMAQFTGLGLSSVFLLNGWARTEKGTLISDLDGLNQEIARALCAMRRPLNGLELRVLRKALKLTVDEVSQLLGEENQLHDWLLEEKEVIPERCEVRLRFMVLKALNNSSVRIDPNTLRAYRRQAVYTLGRRMFFQWNEHGWCQVQPVQLVTA